ncbi:MAG: aminoglycoside phosphotransferase family protein [Anaerolineales bacterium]|nr:aminoglycoside phosphotransferase family protein [Anaerolineales bacterium]
MPHYEPNLDLFRAAFGNGIQDCHVERIKIALGWSRVYRATLTRQDRSARETVIVKTIDPNGPPSAFEAERELRFYQTLHPRLAIPKPETYFLTTDEATGFHIVVMEDLSLTHRIPSHPYQWTRDEIESVLRAYAQLHASPCSNLNYPWLAPRRETLLDFEKIPEQVGVVQRAGVWGELPRLHALIESARESCKKYENEPMSLLHGDTTPANAALLQDLTSHSATLIDWQDAGIGMPEFDLAYLDLQPFDSARLIPRSDLLHLYWKLRAEIEPDIPSPDDRRARQLHADAVTALWLTAPAARVTVHPYPLGSYPQLHWSSQYGIVYNRLKSLAEEITLVE